MYIFVSGPCISSFFGLTLHFKVACSDPISVQLALLPAYLADTMAAYSSGKLKEILSGVGYSI